jgi:hypothetical protein
MRPHDMKYIGFKHQRENKQNSDNTERQVSVSHTHFLIQFVVVYIMPCRSVTGIIAINEERDLVRFL